MGTQQKNCDVNDLSKVDDAASASSLESVADSIFSITSDSSISSLPDPVGAGERLVALLLEDSTIMQLCSDALFIIEQEKFERNLRRLLKDFATELRKEASTIQQHHAAHFVRFRARSSAHVICNSLIGDLVPRKKPNQQHEPNEIDEEDHDSDDDDADGPEDEVQNIQQLELFIKSSGAFEGFREKLRMFIYASEKRVQQKSQEPQSTDNMNVEEEENMSPTGSDKYKSRKDALQKETQAESILTKRPRDPDPQRLSWISGVLAPVLNVIIALLRKERPPVAAGRTRVEWTCVRPCSPISEC
jgi:hypothetical protein